MYLVFKFKNGTTAKVAAPNQWESADPLVADTLNAAPFDVSGASPDPLKAYAEAVAGEFGGALVADTRTRDEFRDDVVY